MAVIFHTSVYTLYTSIPSFCVCVCGGGGGLPCLTERSFVCGFDRTVKFLSNDSKFIATKAEVLKYTVKFNMPKKYTESYDP